MAAGLAASEITALMLLMSSLGTIVGRGAAGLLNYGIDIVLLIVLGGWLWRTRTITAAIVMLALWTFEYGMRAHAVLLSGRANARLAIFPCLLVIAFVVHWRARGSLRSGAKRLGLVLGRAYLGVLAALLALLLGTIAWHSFLGGVGWALRRHLPDVLAAVAWPLAAPLALGARGVYAPSPPELVVVVLLAVAWITAGWVVFISMCWRWSHRHERSVSLTGASADER